MKLLAVILSVVLVLLLGVCFQMVRQQKNGPTEPATNQAQPSEPSEETTRPTQPTVNEPSSGPEETEPTVPVPTEPPAEPKDENFVLITDYIPDAWVELPYATKENFTGTVIYNFTEAYLRYGTVKKLASAAQLLREHGYGLAIWDGYRPVYAQQKLWDVCPDPNYVSKPGTGSQSHCRGIAVDLTLYNLKTGELLEMPSGFDAFSALGDRDYSDCTPAARTNAQLLESIMESCGFKPYSGEWWHFSDTELFDIEYEFDPCDL